MTPQVQSEAEQLKRQIYLSLSPIRDLLEDDSVTDIVIMGYRNVVAKRVGSGGLQKISTGWETEQDLVTACSQVGRSMHRPISSEQPLLDARLPDGSRINIVFPPCHMMEGPCISIRKFPKNRLTAEKLLEKGSIDQTGLEVLRAAVEGGKNLLISGGTGSGKTTLLNVLASYIPKGDRVISIEDSRELQLEHPLWSALECRQKLYETDVEIGLARLTVNALRMFPRWIILGEVRGPEAYELMRAFNTGHSGMATIHANDVAGALYALETLSMAAVDTRVEHLRQYISRAVQVVVQIARFPDDTRRVVDVTEIAGLDEGMYQLNRLYWYDVQEFTAGRVVGEFRADHMPTFRRELRAFGAAMPQSWDETNAGIRAILQQQAEGGEY